MNKNVRIITVITILILILGIIASLMGVFSIGEAERITFTTIRGEEVNLYGNGLYKYDTVSVAIQAISQDAITLIIGIPLLIVSLALFRKGRTRGKLFFTGTIGYFLYTYGTYCFLSAYNEIFIVYVSLFSLSLFAFILSFKEIDLDTLSQKFSNKTPIKSTAVFIIFVGIMLSLMWLGRIVPPLISGGVPYGLESYSTLTIQVFDLGLIVPFSILGGILLLKKRPWGYLITSVLLFKGVTLFTAVATMAIVQVATGINVSIAEVTIFLVLTLVAMAITYRFLRCVNSKKKANLI